MSWQDECVSTAAEAQDFLSQQIETLGYKIDHCEFTRRNIAYFSHDHLSSSGRILSCSFSCGKGELSISRFRTEIPDKQLGSIMLKAILGIACEQGAFSIFIHQVRTHGPAFWPTMAAVPDKSPSLRYYIDRFIEEKKSLLSPHTIKKLQIINRISDINRYLAWRILSQRNFEFAAEQEQFDNRSKLEIFKPLCEADNLIILPGEPTTRAILECRLGALPAFPQACMYADTVRQLARARLPASLMLRPAG